MSRMRKLVVAFLGGYCLAGLVAAVEAQGSLSAQVLRLLDRANTWSLTQTFTLDPQFAAVHTTAPTGTDCDSSSETGKTYFDSSADNWYICSGASGWRKVTTSAP